MQSLNFNYKNMLSVKKFSVVIIILVEQIDCIVKIMTKTDNKNRDCLQSHNKDVITTM